MRWGRIQILSVAGRAFLLAWGVVGVSIGSGRGADAEPRMERAVVLYCAQDQFLAEPLLRQFTRNSGIQVRSVFDSEAVKTVGLANRLLAERAHPTADVFWGNEEFRTRWLANQGIFAETNGWSAFGRRSRRMVINTNQLSGTAVPQSLVELTNTRWRGRVAMAYPVFGTTATHLFSLRSGWGEDQWCRWCRALAANQPFLEEGNSQVVARVGRGEAWVGLTDSDDIAAGQAEGLPIAALPVETWTLYLPNTVGIVRGARHPGAARQLERFLLSDSTLQSLIAAKALEPAEAGPATLHPDWDRVLRDFPAASHELEEIFRK